MKYKVGDKVRVKRGLVQNKLYGGVFWDAQDGMGRFVGKIMTVDSVYEDKYRMLEDDGEWAWTDEMLQPAVNWGDILMLSTGGLLGGKSWLEELFDSPKLPYFQIHYDAAWMGKKFGDCGNVELLNKLGIEKVVFGKKLGRAVTVVRLTDGREGKATQAFNDEADWMIGFGQAYFKALIGKERFKKLVGWLEKKGVYIKGGEKR